MRRSEELDAREKAHIEHKAKLLQWEVSTPVPSWRETLTFGSFVGRRRSDCPATNSLPNRRIWN